jgi:hypothetical protein
MQIIIVGGYSMEVLLYLKCMATKKLSSFFLMRKRIIIIVDLFLFLNHVYNEVE